ncbi:MAG: arginine--tRNA ligase [Francisellaceae bacterium]|nr:arginine--tRNA ligase [Francisellaceae bacterium]MBT6539473.1 arginine--tRNA ligase [Francisellaceae bacterium]
MSLTNDIKTLCFNALVKSYDQLENLTIADAKVTVATQKSFGHYQCNAALNLAKKLKKSPREIASVILENIIKESESISTLNFTKTDIAGPGFINLTLSPETLASNVSSIYSHTNFGIEKPVSTKNVVIDYSSPNVAKEMHVGHLRSTIIGESLARILEFTGNTVSRINHIGDWGTQFGMLIAYFEDQNISSLDFSLSELVNIYRKAKVRFDNEPEFKRNSQLAVVKLQSKDEATYSIWQQICHISQQGYDEIYNILGIENLVVKGESFYNSQLQSIVNLLEQKGMVENSNGAKCVYQPGFTNREGDPLPLIIQKSDGGFNYSTTDLAAIQHRVEQDKANLIIYVVDSGQALHFDMVFVTAHSANIYDPDITTLKHVPFGLVLREDGKKFKTRSGETEKLIDLLNRAIDESKQILKTRTPDIDASNLEEQATKLGINAVKYADLSCNRTSNYKFSYEKMLQFEGNTAAFVNYAYVRAKSIMRKCDKESLQLSEDFILKLHEDSEKELAFHLSLFADTIHQASEELMPNRIAEYIFKLAELFHSFFHYCRVQGSDHENSRLVLCDLTAKIIYQSLLLLGLSPLEKM